MEEERESEGELLLRTGSDRSKLTVGEIVSEASTGRPELTAEASRSAKVGIIAPAQPGRDSCRCEFATLDIDSAKHFEVRL